MIIPTTELASYSHWGMFERMRPLFTTECPEGFEIDPNDPEIHRPDGIVRLRRRVGEFENVPIFEVDEIIGH